MSDTATVEVKPPVLSPVSNVFELPEQFQPGNDIPPTAFGSSDKAPVRCQFDGCTNSVTKPAKGPTSKYCTEHKVNKGASSSTRVSGASWPRAGEVETALTRYAQLIGGGVTFINAVDGETVTKHGPAVSHELVELGRVDKRLRGWLETIAIPGKYGPLALAVAGMVLPIMANHGLIPAFVIGVSTDNQDN